MGGNREPRLLPIFFAKTPGGDCPYTERNPGGKLFFRILPSHTSDIIHQLRNLDTQGNTLLASQAFFGFVKLQSGL